MLRRCGCWTAYRLPGHRHPRWARRSTFTENPPHPPVYGIDRIADCPIVPLASFQVLNLRAGCLLRLQKVEEAETVVAQVLEQDPANSTALEYVNAISYSRKIDRVCPPLLALPWWRRWTDSRVDMHGLLGASGGPC